jgi:hypothetical protein
MPKTDLVGIYVWGDLEAHWHITVAGDKHWSAPRKFYVLLRTPGAFTNLQTTGSAPTPIVSTEGGLTVLLWEGEVAGEWIDLRFDVENALSMELTLYLDTDGDGKVKPKDRPSAMKIVYLRKCRAPAPDNPFVILAELGESTLRPDTNFRVATCIGGGTYPTCRYEWYRISQWEETVGCR